MKSKKNCFDKRQKNEEIVHTGQPAASADGLIPTGSSVTLHSGEARILVAVTDAGPKDTYQGSVLEIQNADGSEVQDLTVDSDLEFTSANIFTCENIAAAA